MEGLWYKEWTPARRFVIKVEPGGKIPESLTAFAAQAGVRNAVLLSAVGSIKNVRFRGIKAGAKLPITTPRMRIHEMEGPLELLGLEGNIFPDATGAPDCHLHILLGDSSGEVIGGHFFEAEVFASCEILLTEMEVEGVERHPSRTGGVATIYIEE